MKGAENEKCSSFRRGRGGAVIVVDWERGIGGGVGAETEAKMNWMMDKHGERKHTLFLTADERKLKIC